MIPIYFCMLQKKNIFLELRSQGQFPEKKKIKITVLRVLTFNLMVKCKN